MKKFQTLAITIFMIVVLLAGFAWATPGWTPVTGNEHNMVAYGKIATGMDFSGGYVLYSFGPAGDQDCRSKSDIKPEGSYYATIVGDAAGEAIHFKIMDGAGNSHELNQTLLFEPDITKEKFDLY